MKQCSILVGIIYFTIIESVNVMAQNLVPNPGFERYNDCPPNEVGFVRKNYVMNWESPTAGTPDYFNACSNQSGVPFNWVGTADAFDGNAYMGIIACMEQLDKNQIAYREYIRVKLTDSLQSGQTYFASMRIFLAQTSIMASNGIGMFFSSGNLASNIRYNYPVKPDVQIPGNPILDTPDKWVQVCGTFKAMGGEQYLFIGNFESDQSMKYKMFDPNLMEANTINPMAYYYIDHVEVFQVTEGITFACEVEEHQNPQIFSGKIEENVPLVLSNLTFKTNEAVILPSSFAELNHLAKLLRQNRTLKLNVVGHTDDSGDDVFNQHLSEERAMAVKAHLIKMGVEAPKITTTGMGSSQPIGSNKTPEGKQLNRRVEITLIY